MARKARKKELAITIIGKVVSFDVDGYTELVLLAWRFRRLLIKAIKMYANDLDKDTIVKEVTRELNLGYADTIYKMAKLIAEGARYKGSNPLKVEVKKLFIASRGFVANKGNRNIRLISTRELEVNIPWKGWVRCKVSFGEKYIPLVEELVKRALSRKLSYTAIIVFRDSGTYLHVSVPIDLYLKYFCRGKARGDLIAGFDLNSDRINMAIIDVQGIIRDTKTVQFPEITSHGFPKNKANTIRLQALAKLLNYAYHHGVGTVVFEDLSRIKKRRYAKSKKANRKISRFPKRKLLKHAVVMSSKYGFKVRFVSPAHTSIVGEVLGRELGLDRHTASAYVVALKALQPKVFKVLKSLYDSQRNRNKINR